MVNNAKSYSLFSIYLLGFLFAFHTALPTYVSSTFLNSFVTENFVGVIYIVANIFALFCFLIMPLILKKFGNYNTAITLVSINLMALLGLAFLRNPFSLIFLFLINLITIPLIYFSTDIFLENFSTNKATGKIRGIYLTSVNLAWAFSPFISGLILVNNDYWKIYLASFFFLIPMLLILIMNLKNFKDPKYELVNVWQTIKIVYKNKNLRNIFSANFMLYFFYSWMTIYTPLYLYKNIGFTWGQIGIVFSIMLLPFVLIQFPLGRLADKKLGEKELLSLGFIIIAISTGVISFISGANMVLWAIILFITRIGASMIEVMCDTYFFKKIDNLDTNIISLYRINSPLAYILGPLLATIMFSFTSFDIKYIFLVLGLFMFIGLRFSLAIKDTK